MFDGVAVSPRRPVGGRAVPRLAPRLVGTTCCELGKPALAASRRMGWVGSLKQTASAQTLLVNSVGYLHWAFRYLW